MAVEMISPWPPLDVNRLVATRTRRILSLKRLFKFRYRLVVTIIRGSPVGGARKWRNGRYSAMELPCMGRRDGGRKCRKAIRHVEGGREEGQDEWKSWLDQGEGEDVF